jgi:hypothetical protein
MADTVTSSKIVDGQKYAVFILTNISDGTGESQVDKVTPSALSVGRLGQACTQLKIRRVWYNTFGMAVSLLWDATADVPAIVLQGDGQFDFAPIGGLPNNSGAGKTGKLQLTTTGASAGDTYSLVLELEKEYG